MTDFTRHSILRLWAIVEGSGTDASPRRACRLRESGIHHPVGRNSVTKALVSASRVRRTGGGIATRCRAVRSNRRPTSP